MYPSPISISQPILHRQLISNRQASLIIIHVHSVITSANTMSANYSNLFLVILPMHSSQKAYTLAQVIKSTKNKLFHPIMFYNFLASQQLF